MNILEITLLQLKLSIILSYVFEQLEKEGYDVTYLDVDDTGAIDLDQLKEALTNDTILVSIMFVNNEVGTVEPMYDIEDIVSESNALFHVDAVQAIGHRC